MANKGALRSGDIQKDTHFNQETIVVKDKPTGFTGTAIVSGMFLEEYLDELNFRNQGYEKFDKMRRSDYTVQRLLMAIETPILSANWGLIPKDPTDEEQVKQADFKNKVLKEWTCKTFQENTVNFLSYLTFGFSVFEPIFHVIEDKDFGQVTTVKDYGFRKQNSIFEWHLNDDGSINHILQRTLDTDTAEETVIPGNELIVFTRKKEGDNYEGLSILRAAYGSWVRKSLYQKIEFIGIEKMAVGTPTAFIPDEIMNDKIKKSHLESVLSSYALHEKQFMLLPDSLKDGGFEVIKGEMNADGIANAIKREDLAILDAGLASFLAIGTMQQGGDKQTEQLLNLFLNSLTQIGNYMAETLDPFIHQIYVMNLGEPEVKLKLEVTGINKRNLKEFSEIVTKFTKENLITPDDAIEAKLRVLLELPELEESVSREERSKKDPEQEPESETEESDDSQEIKNEMTFQVPVDRGLTEFEEKIDLESHRKEFEDSEEEFENIIQNNFAKMRNKYLADLTTALKQSNKDRAVISIKPGFTSQFNKEVKEFLKGLVNVGTTQMAKDMRAEKRLAENDGIVRNLSSRIINDANVTVDNLAFKLISRGSATALNGLDSDSEDGVIIEEVETVLNETLAGTLLTVEVGRLVNKYINTGRNNFGQENKDLVQGWQFSAILDSETTNICRSLDRKTFSPNDTTSFDFRPPLHWNCRSILVPILLSEGKVNLTGLVVQDTVIDGKLITKNEILKQKQFNDAQIVGHGTINSAIFNFEGKEENGQIKIELIKKE